jgi:hypothetical protein
VEPPLLMLVIEELPLLLLVGQELVVEELPLLLLLGQELPQLLLVSVVQAAPQENHLFELLLLVAVATPQPLHSPLALP